MENITSMTSIEELNMIIDTCKEVCSMCDDCDLLDMYSDIVNLAIARLQALEV